MFKNHYPVPLPSSLIKPIRILRNVTHHLSLSYVPSVISLIAKNLSNFTFSLPFSCQYASLILLNFLRRAPPPPLRTLSKALTLSKTELRHYRMHAIPRFKDNILQSLPLGPSIKSWH